MPSPSSPILSVFIVICLSILSTSFGRLICTRIFPAYSLDPRMPIEIARQFDSLETVVISARDTAYLFNRIEGPETKADKESYDWVRGDDGNIVLDNHRAFLAGYEALFRRIRATGKKIVFVTDTPNLMGVDIPGCANPQRFGLERPCSVPRAVVEAFQMDYRLAIGELGASNADVGFVNTASILCSAELCSAKDENKLYYFDQTHLSVSGSVKVWRVLLPIVNGRRS